MNGNSSLYKYQSYKKTSIKNRVEHLQVVNREDIKNMADNDIGGSFLSLIFIILEMCIKIYSSDRNVLKRWSR